MYIQFVFYWSPTSLLVAYLLILQNFRGNWFTASNCTSFSWESTILEGEWNTLSKLHSQREFSTGRRGNGLLYCEKTDKWYPLPETWKKELVVSRLVENFPAGEEHTADNVSECQLSCQNVDMCKRWMSCAMPLCCGNFIIFKWHLLLRLASC